MSNPDKKKGPSKYEQVMALRIRRAEEAEAASKQSRQHRKAVKQLKKPELDALRALEKKIMTTEAPSSKPTIPPVEASAKQQEKKTMAKKAKAKKAPRAKKTRKTPIKGTPAALAAEDSKTAQVVAMIRRPSGTTAQEVCEATGWAAVSIPPIAARAGVKLRKEKEGRSVRYFEAA